MNATFYNLKTIEEKIAYLKNNELELPNIDKYNSEWDEKRHKIMTDLVSYPDRIVEYEYTDELGRQVKGKRVEKLNRIPLAYQKDIVTIALTFLIANPVK